MNASSIVDRKVYDTLTVFCFTKTRPHLIVVKVRSVRFSSFVTNQMYALTPLVAQTALEKLAKHIWSFVKGH